MKRLTTELYGLFDELHKVEDEMGKKFEAIGYGKKQKLLIIKENIMFQK
jgi:hypothetical protein